MEENSSQTNFSKYSLYPIKYPHLYKLFEKQAHAFWVKEDVDLQTDVTEWRETLKPEDKRFLTHILSFFAQADGIVLENLGKNFGIETDIPEANLFFGIQAGIEAIHWDMYSILIETLIDNTEKQAAFNAIENYPCIKRKAEWIQTWMNPETANLQERLVAFACTEGIFFSSAFAGIFYYKKRGLLPGLVKSNEFIARDEGLHRDFGCELMKVLGPAPANTLDIVKDSVEIECEFVRESLNLDLIGINPDMMSQYVGFVADSLLQKLGLPKFYKTENPFPWMDLISLTRKQNFFEGKVSEYKKAVVDTRFDNEADF
jgi:ribonucleotide reductase beta subunit family protein with ferritin-like domain